MDLFACICMLNVRVGFCQSRLWDFKLDFPHVSKPLVVHFSACLISSL